MLTKNKFWKISAVLFLFLSLFFYTSKNIPFIHQVNAAEDQFLQQEENEVDSIDVYFFYGEGCPHCHKEEQFLEKMKEEYPRINIHSYEVWNHPQNAKLLSSIAQQLNINTSGVPALIIGDKHFIGFYNEKTTGSRIRSTLDYYSEKGCSNRVKPILEDVNQKQNGQSCGNEEKLPKEIKLPLFGTIQTKDFSLPALTIIVGGLDGFNPCAMWVLLFLISLLLGMDSKKKMWILGGTFILFSGIVYFLFLSAWLNLFLFLGFILWIRILIGLVALASGGYHFKEFITNPEGSCKVTDGKKRQKVFQKLKDIINKKSFIISLLGIILLAGAVNMVELVCSAGLPAVYTQILSLSDLATWKYYVYLVLYIIVFILDDVVIFVLAMSALQMKFISSKYTKWANLIGGIVMLIIGILLILKPGWIMFG